MEQEKKRIGSVSGGWRKKGAGKVKKKASWKKKGWKRRKRTRRREPTREKAPSESQVKGIKKAGLEGERKTREARTSGTARQKPRETQKKMKGKKRKKKRFSSFPEKKLGAKQAKCEGKPESRVQPARRQTRPSLIFPCAVFRYIYLLFGIRHFLF